MREATKHPCIGSLTPLPRHCSQLLGLHIRVLTCYPVSFRRYQGKDLDFTQVSQRVIWVLDEPRRLPVRPLAIASPVPVIINRDGKPSNPRDLFALVTLLQRRALMTIKRNGGLRVRAPVTPVRTSPTIRPLLGLGLQMTCQLDRAVVPQGEASRLNDSGWTGTSSGIAT